MALERCLVNLQVYGYSLVAINWRKRLLRMDILSLPPVLNQGKRIENEFACISFHHVFRDLNAVAVSLSNLGLPMEAKTREMKGYRTGACLQPA